MSTTVTIPDLLDPFFDEVSTVLRKQASELKFVHCHEGITIIYGWGVFIPNLKIIEYSKHFGRNMDADLKGGLYFDGEVYIFSHEIAKIVLTMEESDTLRIAFLAHADAFKGYYDDPTAWKWPPYHPAWVSHDLQTDEEPIFGTKLR